MSKASNRIQFISGVVLFLFYVAITQKVMNEQMTLGVFLWIGLGLGYAESRSETGIASGYINFFVIGSRSRLYGLLLLFGIGSIGTFFVHAYYAAQGAVPAHLASASATTIPGTSAVTAVNFGLVLGAFLFGVGLTLNKGCGLGTLRNIGLGQTRYLLTILFLLIGTIPGQWVKYQLDQSSVHQFSMEIYFPEHIGYEGTAVLGALVYLSLILFAITFEKKRRKKGRYQSVDAHHLPRIEPDKDQTVLGIVIKNNWARLISILIVTFLLLFALVITGEKLAVTESFKYVAVAFFQQLGVSFSSPAFDDALEVVNGGLFNNHVLLQNLGIIVGAAVFALTSTRFSFTWDATLKESMIYAFSGLLMGFGTVLASGCIVGALYSGIVNFSLSGWVVFASMSAGIWLTVRVMNGKISSIPAMPS